MASLVRGLLWLALTPLAVWLAVCALAWIFQERLIFFPGPRPARTPADVGLGFEELRLGTVDRARPGAPAASVPKLHGWWIPSERALATVLVHHGNAGSIADRLDLALTLHGLRANVLLYDYAGYGASEGSPSAARLLRESAVVWEQARTLAQRDALPLVLWGESLGGAFAADNAARFGCDALVLESAFTSLSDVARDAYPFLPVRLLLRADLETRAALARVGAPTLILHSRDDEIVPIAHGRALFEAARGRKELVEFDGGHNLRGWASDPRALERVGAFLASLAPR